jgi:hypothetical protein
VRRVVTGTDDFNNDVYGESTQDVSNCSVQPSSSRENLNLSDQLSSRITVFVPYGTDVSYIDAIIVGDNKYEVTGSPDVWVSPFSGRTSPIRIEGSLIEGAA